MRSIPNSLGAERAPQREVPVHCVPGSRPAGPIASPHATERRLGLNQEDFPCPPTAGIR